MRQVYLGSLDDRVLEYPWELRENSLTSYLGLMIQNIVVGARPVINDGYCLNNRILRKAMFEDDEPLLKSILNSGEVLIPGRLDSFESLVDEQSKKGIESFQNIPDSVLKNIENVDKALKSSNARQSGPKSIDVWDGYFKMMSSLDNKSVDSLGLHKLHVNDNDLHLTVDKFVNCPTQGKPPSRNEWEKARRLG